MLVCQVPVSQGVRFRIDFPVGRLSGGLRQSSVPRDSKGLARPVSNLVDCATAPATQVWHSCAVSGRHHQSLTRKRNLASDLGRLNLQPRKPGTGAHVYSAAAKRSGQARAPVL